MARTQMDNYAEREIAIAYLPLVLIPNPPTSKAEEKLLEMEARDEVRHAVNTWLYSE